MVTDLSRKYRPTTWSEVLGQDDTVRSIRAVLKAGSKQSFLLTGGSGFGKTTIARILATKVGCEPGNLLEIDGATFTGIDNMRSVARDVAWRPMGESAVQVVIVDECFAAGSLVSTPLGERVIESLCVGDLVYSALGVSTVKRVFVNRVPLAHVVRLRLSSGRVILCSDKHQFLTCCGWCPASSLTAGVGLVTRTKKVPHKLLAMWDTILEHGSRVKVLRSLSGSSMPVLQEGVCSFEEFAAQVLFKNMWECDRCVQAAWRSFFGLATQYRFGFEEVKATQAKNVETCGCKKSGIFGRAESYGQAGIYNEDDRNEKGKWDVACLEGRAWWQWEDYEAAGSAVQGFARSFRVCNTDSSEDGVGVSHVLQSGYSSAICKIGDRGGWQGASYETIEGEGRKENSTTSVVRLESVEVYQRDGDFGLESCCGFCDSAGGFVEFYDLEIEDHPSYVVDGVIVHNCHSLSKQSWQSVLKIVEEPPEGVYWVFCTTESGKVPTTIKTRCASFQLQPVGDDLLFDLLSRIAAGEGYDTPEGVIDFIARQSGGSPRQAITYLGQCYTCKTTKEVLPIIQKVDEEGDAVNLARALVKGGLTWARAMKVLKPIIEQNPESIRLVVLAYLSKVAVGAQSNDVAAKTLAIIDAFSDSCAGPDGKAVILMSVGRAILES